MGSDVTYEGEQYRLRAGAPMPTNQGNILHTFGAEKSRITVIAYTESIVGSSQFRGQGGDLMSANYSRLPNIGGRSFQGKLTYQPTFVDEDSI